MKLLGDIPIEDRYMSHRFRYGFWQYVKATRLREAKMNWTNLEISAGRWAIEAPTTKRGLLPDSSPGVSRL